RTVGHRKSGAAGRGQGETGSGQIERGPDSQQSPPVKDNKPGLARIGGNAIFPASRRRNAPGKEAPQGSNFGPFNQRKYGQARAHKAIGQTDASEARDSSICERKQGGLQTRILEGPL